MAHRRYNDAAKQDDSTLAFDLLAHANSSQMSDVFLVSSDGDQVPASRFVLGARSPVLQQLLCSNPKIKLPYSGCVVRAMVEFCGTNDIVDFVRTATRDMDSVREVVHLYDCARAYSLKKLQELACDMVTMVLWDEGSNKKLCWACAILDEVVANGKDETMTMQRLVLDAIRSDPECALLHQTQDFQPPGVLCLDSTSLELVVSDKLMNCEEVTLFKALLSWSNRSQSSTGHRYAPKDKKRQASAKALMATAIDLSRIAPSDICGLVTQSGLVPQAAIWDALKETALRTERNHEVPISRFRNDDAPATRVLLLAHESKRREEELTGKAHSTPQRRPHKGSKPSPSDVFHPFDDSSIVATEVTPSPRRRRRHSSKSPKTSTEEAPKTDDALIVEDGSRSKSDSAAQESPEKVKGKLITLAEQLDALCVCGSEPHRIDQ